MPTVSGLLDQSGLNQFSFSAPPENDNGLGTGSSLATAISQTPIVRQIAVQPIRIVCVLCDEQFSSDTILPHVAAHFRFNLYSCADCGDSGNCSDSMQLHGLMTGHRIVEGQTLDKEAYDLTMKIAQRCYKMNTSSYDEVANRVMYTEDELKQEHAPEETTIDVDANFDGGSDLPVPDFSSPLNISSQQMYSPHNKRQRCEVTAAVSNGHHLQPSQFEEQQLADSDVCTYYAGHCRKPDNLVCSSAKKRHVLTLAERIGILRALDANEIGRDVALRFGVSASAVSRTAQRRAEILEQYETRNKTASASIVVELEEPEKSFAEAPSSFQDQPIGDGHSCANCGRWFPRLRQMNCHLRYCKPKPIRPAGIGSAVATIKPKTASKSVEDDLEIDTEKNEASKPMEKKRARRWWVRPMFQCRDELGEFQKLVKELRNSDDEGLHFNYFRMSKEKYFELLKLVEPAIKPMQNNLREAITADERLCITLRFLASGDSLSALSSAYRISKAAICNFVRQTLAAILDSLSETYLKQPITEKDYRKIAAEFDSCWNFPTALGALDGRYVEIQKPPQTETQHQNEAGCDSVVLLVVCDAKYVFRFVELGAARRADDATIFSTSEFMRKLNSNELQLLQDLSNGMDTNLPFVFLGNEAFPLHEHIVRPFNDQVSMPSQQAVFNYRLSRAHSVVDNALGLLACRWRIFQRKICAAPSLIDSVIKTTICLHNFLMTTEPAFYCPFGTMDYEDITKNVIDGNWRKDTVPLKQICDQDSNNFCHVAAADVRNRFCDYFLSEPGVSWQ